MVRWHIYPNVTELVERGAGAILRIARQSIAERGHFHLVLAGGTTPRTLYEYLSGEWGDWARWSIYFGDERCLPPDDAERNSVMAATAWLDKVAIPRLQIFPIPAENGPEEGAAAYRPVVDAVGTFDLVLLGLGEDGHTASLFPGHDWGVGDEAAPVLAVRSAPKPPPERVSLSAYRLSRSRQVMVLVSGAGKQEAVNAWRSGAKLPVTAVRPAGGVEALLTLDAWAGG